MIKHKKSWCAAAVLNNYQEAASGPQPLNTVDMPCLCDSLVPFCSGPIIESLSHRRRQRSQSHRVAVVGREAEQDGYWMGGWVETSWSQPVLSPGPDLPIPHTVGRLRAGPCARTETHTGQQIMRHVSCYCGSFTLYNTEDDRIHCQSYNITMYHLLITFL